MALFRGCMGSIITNLFNLNLIKYDDESLKIYLIN